MTIREKILVIEDEKSISHFISTVLNNNGYEAMQAQTGEEALSMISSHCPDLVILDLGLPDMDGLDILRSLRSWSSLPVVVVSARSHERDKVAALDLGADDYLTKPFGTDELLARVRTAIRHTRTISGNDEIARNGTYTVGELVIDYNKHQVRVRGENVHLTLSEFRIVALLGKYAGKVLTYDFIIKELWGPRASGDNQICGVYGGFVLRRDDKGQRGHVCAADARAFRHADLHGHASAALSDDGRLRAELWESDQKCVSDGRGASSANAAGAAHHRRSGYCAADGDLRRKRHRADDRFAVLSAVRLRAVPSGVCVVCQRRV